VNVPKNDGGGGGNPRQSDDAMRQKMTRQPKRPLKNL
jgi:hypothetical protein